MIFEPNPHVVDSFGGELDGNIRSLPFSKLEFPQFDGYNPQWWCDQYDISLDIDI
jgi:hypothetical protein